jgi:hypothetical protein
VDEVWGLALDGGAELHAVEIKQIIQRMAVPVMRVALIDLYLRFRDNVARFRLDSMPGEKSKL